VRNKQEKTAKKTGLSIFNIKKRTKRFMPYELLVHIQAVHDGVVYLIVMYQL